MKIDTKQRFEKQGLYSQHCNFIVTCESAHSARALIVRGS